MHSTGRPSGELLAQPAQPLSTIIPPSELYAIAPAADVNALLAKLPKYGYNPALAKQEMAESSHPNGFTFTLTSLQGFGFYDIAQVVAADLKPLGITVNIKIVPLDTWLALLTGANRHEAGLQLTTPSSGSFDVSDEPSFILGSVNTASGGFNIANWAPPDVDTLIDEGVRTPNGRHVSRSTARSCSAWRKTCRTSRSCSLARPSLSRASSPGRRSTTTTSTSRGRCKSGPIERPDGLLPSQLWQEASVATCVSPRQRPPDDGTHFAQVGSDRRAREACLLVERLRPGEHGSARAYGRHRGARWLALARGSSASRGTSRRSGAARSTATPTHRSRMPRPLSSRSTATTGTRPWRSNAASLCWPRRPSNSGSPSCRSRALTTSPRCGLRRRRLPPKG